MSLFKRDKFVGKKVSYIWCIVVRIIEPLKRATFFTFLKIFRPLKGVTQVDDIYISMFILTNEDANIGKNFFLSKIHYYVIIFLTIKRSNIFVHEYIAIAVFFKENNEGNQTHRV